MGCPQTTFRQSCLFRSPLQSKELKRAVAGDEHPRPEESVLGSLLENWPEGRLTQSDPESLFLPTQGLPESLEYFPYTEFFRVSVCCQLRAFPGLEVRKLYLSQLYGLHFLQTSSPLCSGLCRCAHITTPPHHHTTIPQLTFSLVSLRIHSFFSLVGWCKNRCSQILQSPNGGARPIHFSTS